MEGVWKGIGNFLDKILCLVTSSGRENVAKGSYQLFVKYCHTRSNLGISDVLEILQSSKLDHKVAGNQTFM